MPSDINGAEALTFDDISLIPRYSEVLPTEVSTAVKIGNIKMGIPIFSAAMDTVSEYGMGIAMALSGGIAVIHKNMQYKDQIKHVRKVKLFTNRIISEPVEVKADDYVANIPRYIKERGFSTFPVIGADGNFVGEISDMDITDIGHGEKIADKMRNISQIKSSVVVQSEDECSKKYDELKKKLIENRDKTGYFLLKKKIAGMITRKDIDSISVYPNACKDSMDRLVCAAAVAVSVSPDHIQALVECGADIICIDSAHGNSKNVVEAITRIRKFSATITIMAGNVVDGDGAKRLLDAGVNIVKVGVGAGSICSTRVVTGVGVPMITSIQSCAKVCDENGAICVADGGMRTSGDIVKALSCGADAVMLGSMLAGVDESPGEKVTRDGIKYCKYVGMGHISKLKSYPERYGHKKVSEGVEAEIPYKGPLADVLNDIIGGIQAGMGYMGAKTVEELAVNFQYVKVTYAGTVEAGPHIYKT
jgi:IMP dehydrogenase